MNLIISFSARTNGNCDEIASYVSSNNDKIIYFRNTNNSPCSNCNYECFDGECIYRNDDVYSIYEEMVSYDKVILIVPMYGGNPSSLYFIFNERSQDYFMHNDNYEEIIKRLYIIGVYGSKEEYPDFIPCLEKWFVDSTYNDRVLGIERHLYNQQLNDSVLAIKQVKDVIVEFMKR
ncbi:MAG: flavodoxin family protein [Erysipelotrichales bacterium]|nr:flavodoxin family protein [Erysipelotrichales bacterium]